jgi:hypothetical protein
MEYWNDGILEWGKAEGRREMLPRRGGLRFMRRCVDARPWMWERAWEALLRAHNSAFSVAPTLEMDT